MKAVLIAGDRSGSGKTSITLALAGLLARSYSVQTFKVGMDYIDPSYHTAVTGRPCRNLDSYVMDAAQMRQIFAHGCRGADIAIVEGVRGLFEGAEALTDLGSTAAIAKLLDIPVVLVVSARSITRSAAAIVRGFQAFDPGVRISGVILNNISGGRHGDKAVTAIEHYTGVPVIGAVPRVPEMALAMRHLGLVPYTEGEAGKGFRERLGEITRIVGEHVPPERLLALAGDYQLPKKDGAPFEPAVEPDVTIGIALV